MKKLLGRTHSNDSNPTQIVYSPTKTSSPMKSLRSPKIENADANEKIANGHGGNKATKQGENGEQKQKFVRLRNWITDKQVTDTLHQQISRPSHCDENRCLGSSMFPSKNCSNGELIPKDVAKKDAVDFLRQYYASLKKVDTPAHNTRVQQVLKEIDERGTYEMDGKELVFGAKLAWRNAPRCVGRIQWNKLQVFDCRDVFNAQQMFEAICKHIKYGTNKGNLRSAITIFPQRRGPGRDFRVWNSQFIRYAGYKKEDGSIMGDPANVEFTEVCMSLGWQPKHGRFDVLPLILQANGDEPEVFEIPEDLILEVNFTHPEFEWFGDLGLKWYAIPAVSSLMLNCGGVEFTACPFNGWYMGTEIGARNFGDTYRYNMLPTIAEKMGLNTSSNATLWKDKAMVELNIAVLHSFQLANVTIADHHSTTESFMKHVANEVCTWNIQRFYSISSSPQAHPGEIHATVAVVRFKKENGQGSVHNGVCSTWIESLKPGDMIPCSVRHAHSFHMPEDPSLPVIMVGPGTGIAPFRSFWQQRLFDKKNKLTNKGKNQRPTSFGKDKNSTAWGPLTLYFGCRSSEHDDIYKHETSIATQEGGLDNVYTAFSREPNVPKTYVQDLIKKNASEIYEMLVKKGGHFYVCGDVSMAEDVHNSLESALEAQGKLSNSDTKDFVQNMKTNGIYHEDIFGITLRTKETTDRARQKRGTLASGSSFDAAVVTGEKQDENKNIK